MSETQPDPNVIEMAAEIVSAYVRNNSVPVGELPTLLQSVHDALGGILTGAKPEAPKEPLQPKVPVKKSVTTEYIVCLEDGKRFKSLKRHLHSEHGLSPQDYREKWGLAKDYPMVAPAYADARPTWRRRWASAERPAPCRPSKCPSLSPSPRWWKRSPCPRLKPRPRSHDGATPRPKPKQTCTGLLTRKMRSSIDLLWKGKLIVTFAARGHLDHGSLSSLDSSGSGHW